MPFLCPKCALPLILTEHTFRCASGHCYDRAKSGYVNLLPAAKGTHGDDRRMVRARKAFLGGGHYAPLIEQVTSMTAARACGKRRLLDCGCGEGSYTAAIAQALPQCEIIGVDVSKDAVEQAAKRVGRGFFAVASVFHLPLPSSSVDGILNLFAPMAQEEYARVLKPKGWVLKATPLPEHLYELKAAIYDEVRPTEPEPADWNGFSLCEEVEVRFPLSLTSASDIQALFEMAPYCYTTSSIGLARLARLDALNVRAAFRLALYEKFD